jgi:hypothetical protein
VGMARITLAGTGRTRPWPIGGSCPGPVGGVPSYFFRKTDMKDIMYASLGRKAQAVGYGTHPLNHLERPIEVRRELGCRAVSNARCRTPMEA